MLAAKNKNRKENVFVVTVYYVMFMIVSMNEGGWFTVITIVCRPHSKCIISARAKKKKKKCFIYKKLENILFLRLC